MKKQRYKFDDAWRVAMITADVDNPGRIERMIRAYIEDDIEPESTFAIERTFRGAWTVIKAQIKARKERNRRAAERRRQRRQEALAAKAAAEAAQSISQVAESTPQPSQSASQTASSTPQPSQSDPSVSKESQSGSHHRDVIGLASSEFGWEGGALARRDLSGDHGHNVSPEGSAQTCFSRCVGAP